MSSEAFLEKYFVEVSSCDVGGMEGDKFHCCLPSGEDCFVKVRSKDVHDWLVWGLRKEYLLSEVFSRFSSNIPSSVMLCENENWLGVAFEREVEAVTYNELLESPELLEEVVRDLREVIETLGTVEEKVEEEYLLDSIKGREHKMTYGFTDTQEYMFSDRLEGEVFVANNYYDEFKKELQEALEIIIQEYDTARETLVHGDLLNPDNVLFSPEGVEAVVDWEISGWFDYLYDLASIEAMYIDRPSHYNTNFDADLLRDVLYEPFDLLDESRKIINCYKYIVHYVELEGLSSEKEQANTKNNINREFEAFTEDFEKQYDILTTLQSQINEL